MRKLCKKLFESEEIGDIPTEYVIRVVSLVFEIINSGECFFFNEWAMFENNVKQYEVAKLLGIHESVLSRKLREELPDEEQEKIVSKIKGGVSG